MIEERTYTQKEVDSIKTEERFITYLVLSSAGVKLAQMPKQYRDARFSVADIVDKSKKYDDDVKEKFYVFLTFVDNCVPPQERPQKYFDAYNTVIADILAPPKE